MSDRIQSEPGEVQMPEVALPAPRLPSWLARRFLREDEIVESVYGPRLNPGWECYVTHPLLFLVAMVIASVLLGLTYLAVGSVSELPPLPVVGAGGVLVGAIIVLGLSCGYFTRLVVTNRRLMILQGYEMRRQWSVEDLPLSLIRYSRAHGAELTKRIDLDALKTILGGSAGQVADAKTIMSLGKRLTNIRGQQKPRR